MLAHYMSRIVIVRRIMKFLNKVNYIEKRSD